MPHVTSCRVNPRKKDCVLFVTEGLLKMRFISCVNELREDLFKSIIECHPGLEDMELREKFINKNMKKGNLQNSL